MSTGENTRSAIHVFSEGAQPATRFVDKHGPKPVVVRFKPRQLLYCDLCNKRRRAANLEVRVYYDMTQATCVKGKGCKS